MFRSVYLVLCIMNDFPGSCFRFCDEILSHIRANVLQMSALFSVRCYPGPFISGVMCPCLRFVPISIVSPAPSIFTSSV
jgi:hypothetical protein